MPPKKINNMQFLYSLGLKLYHSGILIFSLFNGKAKKWVNGRKNLFKTITERIRPGEKIIWFHAASLGEFEQGRPVIEAIRKSHTEYKILITFFSPSGYEIRKNYAGADYIFYLPFDSKKNAKKFIGIVQPEKVFFIKYEFWYHYLNSLYKKNIPVYLISGIFRKDQVFFKWYGTWFRKMLRVFKHVFVQDENSLQLLKTIGIHSVSVSGDTRFDRVAEIARQAKSIDVAEKFRDNKITFICGSTWEKDEEHILKYINESALPVKFIIAPHEIDEGHIQHIISKLKKSYTRYSMAEMNKLPTSEVLIIDNIGMLSSLYKYGDVAYIGGGFGVSIHNILEPATFELPVVFGPNFRKFKEAVDLISSGGAFTISSFTEVKENFDNLLNDQVRQEAGKIAKNYILVNCGATHTIMKFVFD